MKAYIVTKCCDCDDGIDIGVYLDKDKCEKDVTALNKPRIEEEKLYFECKKCVEDENGLEDKEYRLRDKCNRSCIKKDRYGEYCENDKSNYYNLNEPSYYINEVELFGQDKLAILS